MNYRHICTSAMIAHHGLRTAHSAANHLGHGEEKPDMGRAVDLHSIRLLFFRHMMLEIANIADVAAISRAMYKEHPDLGALYAELTKAFEFFKYIRNKYVGHLVPELTDKTFEWQPTAHQTFGKVAASDQLILSWFILETVINTYTDPTTGHRIFDSETDLNYPPDQKRFLNFLGESAEKSLKYSERLIEAAASYVEVPDIESEWLTLAIEAGKTEFGYLKKKGR